MQRFKTRAQFQTVLAEPAVARTTHFALHSVGLPLLRPGRDADGLRPEHNSSGVDVFATGSTWVGAMVPKRWAKRAVTRNMIKRQIYTVASLSELGAGAAYVVRLRAGYGKTQFTSATSIKLKAAVRRELEQLVSLPQSTKLPGAKTASSSLVSA